jgi:hypothetical protein
MDLKKAPRSELLEIITKVVNASNNNNSSRRKRRTRSQLVSFVDEEVGAGEEEEEEAQGRRRTNRRTQWQKEQSHRSKIGVAATALILLRPHPSFLQTLIPTLITECFNPTYSCCCCYCCCTMVHLLLHSLMSRAKTIGRECSNQS